MSTLTCSRCGLAADHEDNFCRRCGHQLTVNLPAVRATHLPVRVRPGTPALVGSVAVLALGTGLEWLTRRMAGSAARAAGRALIGQERSPNRRSAETGSAPEQVEVDEFVYIRKVQLRR